MKPRLPKSSSSPSSRVLLNVFVAICVSCAIVIAYRMDPTASMQRQVYIQDDEEVSSNSPFLPACVQNPYREALREPLEVIVNRAGEWIGDIAAKHRRATEPRYKEDPSHARYFPFEPMATCKNRFKSCIGGECREDTSKIVCGAELLEPGCVIYSIGGNNQWEFELDALANTPCEVHTFDCTGDRQRFEVPQNDRLHFHHICLSDSHAAAPPPEQCVARGSMCGETWTLKEMQKQLGHRSIDMLKMDIEGYEWPLFESWPEINIHDGDDELLLPMQIVVEVHYDPNRRGWSASEIVELQAHLLRMGYVVAERDDNMACLRCTELTLIRVGCPQSGVYDMANQKLLRRVSK